MQNENFKYPLFVKGDFDGFIGLFIDNLVNLLIITGLCLSIGMSAQMVFGKILPSTALAVLAGNIFYSWQAKKLAERDKRLDVTALPYGINTVSLFAFFSLIIAPIYLQTKDENIAWQAGVISCLICGIFEGLGAFVGDRIRRITPRAALLAALSGIAIAFIAIDQTIKIWNKPVIAMIPLALILIEYFSRRKLPFRIPAGFYALAAGGILAWTTGEMSVDNLTRAAKHVDIYFPGFAIIDAFSGLTSDKILPYLSISIPMGIMSFFGTLLNLESAAAAGDNYPAMPALAMNGIGTIIGAMFGSPFPATVYIGHPGWKGLGARAGYSIINGAAISVISFTGLMSLVASLIPLEAGYPILLWIGAVITAQAFQTTPGKHAPAVAIGLMPAIASWGLSLLRQYINKDGGYTTARMDVMIGQALPHIKEIISYSEGALLSSIFLTATAVYLIDKDFLKAFLWSLPLSLFTFFGVIHSTTIGINVLPSLFTGYLMFSGVILLMFLYDRYSSGSKIID